VPPEAVVQQVIRGARFLLKDDVSEVRVRLEPPELGSVHIRLTSGESALSGEISVSSSEVKGIVESHLHELRSSLIEQGLHVGRLDVSVRDGQSGGTWSDRMGGFGYSEDAPDGRPGRHGNPEWDPQEEARRPGHSQSLVDYFA
jgi:flagellar hook-length control protein FliK